MANNKVERFLKMREKENRPAGAGRKSDWYMRWRSGIILMIVGALSLVKRYMSL